jgi:hypothetical protein
VHEDEFEQRAFFTAIASTDVRMLLALRAAEGR